MHSLDLQDKEYFLKQSSGNNSGNKMSISINPHQHQQYVDVIRSWHSNRHRGYDLPKLLLGLMYIGKYKNITIRKVFPQDQLSEVDPVDKMLIGEGDLPNDVKLEFYLGFLKTRMPGQFFGIENDDLFQNDGRISTVQKITQEVYPHDREVETKKHTNEAIWLFVNHEANRIQHEFEAEWSKFLEQRKQLSAFPNSLPSISTEEKIQQKRLIASQYIPSVMKILMRAYELCK